MSDPAVEAANRAWAGHTHPLAQDVAEQAAREALAPLRKLHQKTICEEDGPLCFECESEWPCATARLIYSADEL